MEDSRLNCLQELPKANPIQKKVSVPPRSIVPLLSLPHFRQCDQQQELAVSLNPKEHQLQHNLFRDKLSQLFKDPLYQSNPKFSLEASNLNFACLKVFYCESSLHPAAIPQIDRGEEQFQFESRFESGNLAFATRGQAEREYFLLLQKDTNSTRCTQWFFFRVKNKAFTGKATFRILNFFKNYSSYQNGMKVLVCSQSNKYTWTRGCEDISYMKNNLKIGQEKTYYSLSFSYNFVQQYDTTYFAHSQPYTYTMLDKYLLRLDNCSEYNTLYKRRTLTESPGGNSVELLTITNFSNKKDKKVVFITSRVHPGQSPSSFVCEGLIDYLLSSNEEIQQLRDEFIFKVVPMLNPDGVINGNYRCSLSGYDLNRVWHYDNKVNSPQIFFTKRAILQHGRIFMFIDLHAHSKKKGVFMYGCQNKSSPFISRHIPYLFWKEIEHFNYYQCNFGMKLGREGTSRLNIHRALNLNFSYTMEHSFCGPVKEKVHFTARHYKEIGAGIAKTLKKYYCAREEPEILKELEKDKQLLQVGVGENNESSDDSQLQEPTQFTQMRQVRVLKRKQSAGIRSKIVGFSCDSTKRFKQRNSSKPIEKESMAPYFNQTFISRNYIKKVKEPLLMEEIIAPQFQKSEEILGEQVILTGRFSQLQQRTSIQQIRQQPQSKCSERYSFKDMDCLNNLFLPSLTSASYKRYAKKKNYPKHFVQVGKAYLQTRGLLKQEIRSVSSNKKHDWKTNALSFL